MYQSAAIGELPERAAASLVQRAPKLIIFDCDGVWVHREEITLSVLISLLNDDVPDPATLQRQYLVEPCRGRKSADCLSEAEQILNVRLPDQFAQGFRAQALSVLTRELKTIEGLCEVLEGLKVPCCVVSSARRHKIEQCLQLTGLFPYFEGRIFSCYELGRWKPDPLVILTACQAYEVDVSDALVIDGSVTGVQAAIAAPLSVLGFGPLSRHRQLAQTGAQPFADRRELLAIIN